MELPQAVGDTQHRVDGVAARANDLDRIVWPKIAPKRKHELSGGPAISHDDMNEAAQLNDISTRGASPTWVVALVEVPQAVRTLLHDVESFRVVLRLRRCPERLSASLRPLLAFRPPDNFAIGSLESCLRIS